MDKQAAIFRSPICSVVGHVDAGKTSFLDKLRGSSIQNKEVGKITQKIGVTFFSKETLTKIIGPGVKRDIDIPGMLLIDTPGHECFTNQRMCGIEVSDIVIVVVDIFRGLEQQTIECLELLKKTNTPFIIVANKLDRISEWASPPPTSKMSNLKSGMNRQKKYVKNSLESYIGKLSTQCAENGYNAIAYYQNKNPKQFISIVPVSSKTGEGLPDLLMMVNVLTSTFLKKGITIRQDITTGYIIEKMKDKKHGDIITTILTDGMLQTKSSILIMNTHNEIVETKVKYIFVPDESKEIKDKLALKSVDQASAGASVVLKIESNDHVRVGSRFYVFGSEKEKTHYQKKILMDKRYDETNLADRVYASPGIYLNAPTVGMMIALLNLCDSNSIPISGINIGSITKIHIIKASTHVKSNRSSPDDEIYYRRYGVILGYDTDAELSKELLQIAQNENVEIFTDNIIYHLVDKYNMFVDELDKEIKNRHPSLYPKCELQILGQYIFMKKDPILFGVRVMKNKIRKGMNIMATRTNNGTIILGKVTSIQKDNKSLDEADTNDEVCIKIESGDKKFEYGRDFDDSNLLKTYYSQQDTELMAKYNKIFLQ